MHTQCAVSFAHLYLFYEARVVAEVEHDLLQVVPRVQNLTSQGFPDRTVQDTLRKGQVRERLRV